jgi:hypothetical protein
VRANRILQRGAFTPEDFARIQGVFDDAWMRVAPKINRAERAKSRETLATIVLSLATARTDQGTAEMTEMAVGLLGVVVEVT